MLSLRVAIGPGIALLALLVVTSTGGLRVWCCLLVEGSEVLLVVRIYRCLPLLIWIVRVVRHLSGSMALAQQKLVRGSRCNIERGGSVDDINRKVQLHGFD